MLGALILSVAALAAAPTPGLHERSFEYGGVKRTYLLFVPTAYKAGKPLPLAVGLHGGTGTADGFVRMHDVDRALEARRMLGVFPQGVGAGRGGTWNAMHCCGVAHRLDLDDTGFIRALVASLQEELKVDPRRIYAFGHSNGAMMSHRLAAEVSDVFAAIAEYAGTIGGQESPRNTVKVPRRPAGPISVLMMHGKLDESVLYAGGHGPRTTGGRLDLSTRASITFWASALSCSTTPAVTTSPNGNIVTEAYRGCRNRVYVTLVTVNDGEHPFTTVAENGIDTTATLLDFLAQHSKT